jgi:ATP-binding cassette subfamily F protein uup
VLLVTHDREFLDNVVTSTFAFEGDGRVVEYVGGWEDYVRQVAGRTTVAEPAPAPELAAEAATARAGPPARRKKTFREEREYAALPARIEDLEAEQRRLQDEVGSAEFYKSPKQHIDGVLARIDAIHGELEEALARWIELEEIGR